MEIDTGAAVAFLEINHRRPERIGRQADAIDAWDVYSARQIRVVTSAFDERALKTSRLLARSQGEYIARPYCLDDVAHCPRPLPHTTPPGNCIARP